MAYVGRPPSNATLSSVDIADGIIVAADLAPDSVGASELADDAVDTAAIADSVTLVTPTIASMANCTFPDGHILQTVATHKTDINSWYSTGGADKFREVPDLNVAITPASASNKVLVMVQLTCNTEAATQSMIMYVERNGSAVDYRGNAAGSKTRAITGAKEWGGEAGDIDSTLVQFMGTFLDSPSATTEQTYKVFLRHKNENTWVFINRIDEEVDDVDNVRGASSIIVMEVKG